MFIGNKRLSLAYGWLAFISLMFVLPIYAMLKYLPSWQVLKGIVTEPYTVEIFIFSLQQAITSVVISVILGLSLARALHRRQFFAKKMYIVITSLPIVMPVVLASASFVFLYGPGGWVETWFDSIDWFILKGWSYPFASLGFWAIVAVHVFFNAPLAMRVFYQSLENIPQNYWRLGQSFGWSSMTMFRIIEWPAIQKQIYIIAILIFLLCFTAFSSVLLLSSHPLQATFEVAIYQSLKYDQNFTHIAVYGLLQLTICLLVYLTICRTPISDDYHLPASEKSIHRGDEKNQLLQLSDTALLLVFLVFTSLPMVTIVWHGFNVDAWQVLRSPSFSLALTTTLKVALGAALLATLIGYFIAYLQHHVTLKLAQSSNHKAHQATYHLQKGVLFLLMIIPKLNLVLPAIMFIAAIFILYGSTLIPGGFYLLMILNALWMIPFVIKLVSIQLNKVSYYDKLSTSLAMSSSTHWWYVEWPIIKKPIALSMAIAMAFSIGDFGIIAVVNHDGLLTLPMYMYQLMGAYQMAQAKIVALVILILIMLSFLLFSLLENSAMFQRLFKCIK